MNLNGLFIPIIKIAMIFVRAGAVWMLFPIFSQMTIPVLVRLGGGLTLSLALLQSVGPYLPNWSLQSLPSNSDLLGFCVREFLIGAGLGLVARWTFSSVVAAAHWVGSQMGFSQAGLFDPEMQNAGDNAWSSFNQWIGIMIFFGIGGPIYFIQAMADSYRIDVTKVYDRLIDTNSGLAFWSEVGSRFFVWMLKLGGPMAVVLLLIQIAMGVLSKFVPQVNMWVVSLPVTLGVGIFVFTLFSPMYGDALVSLFRVNFETNYLWLRFLGAR